MAVRPRARERKRRSGFSEGETELAAGKGRCEGSIHSSVLLLLRVAAFPREPKKSGWPCTVINGRNNAKPKQKEEVVADNTFT